MKSYNHIIDKIVSYDNLEKALNRSSKGKKNRKDVRWCLAHKETVIKEIQKMILNETFVPPKHTPKEINDGIVRKKRTIIQPHYKYEQIIHHAIVQVISPDIERSSYRYSCGSMPGRGATFGKKYIEKYIRENPSKCKYVLKMDIHHYFESIDHDIIIGMIRKKYHDEKFCRLMEKIIRSESGLPIGYYTSQWLANWYLQGLDYFIKQECGAKCYVRYMDDMVIIGSNKKELHKTREKVAEYLKERLNLELKDNWQVFQLKNRFIDFMGFRFYRYRTTLRRTIFFRAVRKAKRLSHLTWYNACQMLSYLGWFAHTQCYTAYLKWIKPYVSARKLKKRISVHQRRVNDEIKMA